MQRGMGPVFRGGFFDSALTAKDYTARMSNQMNPETLNASGIGLIVFSIYAHPWLNLSTRASVRDQLALARRFVHENPSWVIALNASDARMAYQSGKRLVVLGLEGAAGVLETDNDLREFVDEGGIRIVTLLHLTDDHLGGAALLGGLKSIFSPIEYLRQIFSPRRDPQGVSINRNGLTDEGAKLTGKLLERGVWIDLSHSSDEAQKALFPILREAGQPLLYTHTFFRSYYGAERAISEEQLRAVAESSGVIGLAPSEDMLAGTPPRDARCPDSIRALASQYERFAARVGAERVAFGSDFNGGVSHLARPSCPTGTAFDETGLWNVSQAENTWKALDALGVLPRSKEKGWQVRGFLEAWQRVKAFRGTRVSAQVQGSMGG